MTSARCTLSWLQAVFSTLAAALLCAAASPIAAAANEDAEPRASERSAPAATASNSTALAVLGALRFPSGEPRGFAEQQFNPMLKAPVASRGRVWVEPDQTMVMELTRPRAEQRRLLGTELTLSRPRLQPGAAAQPADFTKIHHRLTLKASKPAHLVLLAAGALLRGERDWIADHFSLSSAARHADQSGTTSTPWEVLLVPLEAGVREQLPWIRLTGQRDQLTGLRADRGANGWQQLDFFALTPAAAP